MSTRRKRMYRYSFDSSGNFLGAVQVNPVALYVRRGLVALALLLSLGIIISSGCHSTTRANFSPKPQLAAPQIQLPL